MILLPLDTRQLCSLSFRNVDQSNWYPNIHMNSSERMIGKYHGSGRSHCHKSSFVFHSGRPPILVHSCTEMCCGMFHCKYLQTESHQGCAACDTHRDSNTFLVCKADGLLHNVDHDNCSYKNKYIQQRRYSRCGNCRCFHMAGGYRMVHLMCCSSHQCLTYSGSWKGRKMTLH